MRQADCALNLVTMSSHDPCDIDAVDFSIPNHELNSREEARFSEDMSTSTEGVDRISSGQRLARIKSWGRNVSIRNVNREFHTRVII